MKFLELLGTLFGIGIVVFPLSALGFLIFEFTKPVDSRSFLVSVFCIALFVICGFGLVIVANIIEWLIYNQNNKSKFYWDDIELAFIILISSCRYLKSRLKKKEKL